MYYFKSLFRRSYTSVVVAILISAFLLIDAICKIPTNCSRNLKEYKYKSIFRYIILILSSLGLAYWDLTHCLLTIFDRILAENPGYKMAIIAIIFVGYFVMYLITTLIMSFICCLFFKITTKNKEQFNLKAAQKYNKFSITLLIALHVICFGLQLFTNYIVYAILYTIVGLLIVWLFTRQYKRRRS